jgi:hypothetical protein
MYRINEDEFPNGSPSRVGGACVIPNQTTVMPKPRHWLISKRADFWFTSAGASGGLLAALALIFLSGDREIDWLDLVLSELHLGATYDAIARRRLWRRLPIDVLVVPLAILAATYLLAINGQAVLITSIAMYAAVWHRGRQSLGIARFYQRLAGGSISPLHSWLFAGTIYLPMTAAIFLYGHLAPENYEGEPYYALGIGADVSWGLGLIAAGWVVAYFIWTARQTQWAQSNLGERQKIPTLHPGERWVVLAHAVAFGSAYVLGATNASFLLVLAVHHEVQYLYFTYAMARSPTRAGEWKNSLEKNARSEIRFAASFVRWPLIGLAGAVVGGWYQFEWLAPLGVGGLFCHYWLDGRIWTRRSMQAGLVIDSSAETLSSSRLLRLTF